MKHKRQQQSYNSNPSFAFVEPQLGAMDEIDLCTWPRNPCYGSVIFPINSYGPSGRSSFWFGETISLGFSVRTASPIPSRWAFGIPSSIGFAGTLPPLPSSRTLHQAKQSWDLFFLLVCVGFMLDIGILACLLVYVGSSSSTFGFIIFWMDPRDLQQNLMPLVNEWIKVIPSRL